MVVFFFKQKTAYEMRISDWSSDVCSSDLDGYAKVDPTLQHPRSVYQLLKKHYERYTPEMVARVCGTPEDKFLKVCEMLASTAAKDRAGTILYALGWTQHSIGAQIIRTGEIGRASGGERVCRYV